MELRKVVDILKERMKRDKISQYKLAEKTGISRTYIGDILSKRKSHGSKDAMEKMIQELGFSQDERIEIWSSWLYEKGHEEIIKHYKEIERKYLESIKK